MEIRTSQEQGRSVAVTVIHLKGEFNSDEELVSIARQAYDLGVRNILVDLSEVPYISSAGLRALHSLFLMLRSEAPAESLEATYAGIAKGTFTSPHLKLFKPSALALKALKTAGMDMFIEIYQDYKKALASFS